MDSLLCELEPRLDGNCLSIIKSHLSEGYVMVIDSLMNSYGIYSTIKTLSSKGDFKNMCIFSYAYKKEWDLRLDALSDIAMAVATTGDLESLRLFINKSNIKSNMKMIQRHLFEGAAISNNPAILDWIYKRNCQPPDYGIVRVAASHNCIQSLEWLKRYGKEVDCEWKEDVVLKSAVQSGSMEACRWLCENGYGKSLNAVFGAVQNGDLDIIRWALNDHITSYNVRQLYNLSYDTEEVELVNIMCRTYDLIPVSTRKIYLPIFEEAMKKYNAIEILDVLFSREEPIFNKQNVLFSRHLEGDYDFDDVPEDDVAWEDYIVYTYQWLIYYAISSGNHKVVSYILSIVGDSHKFNDWANQVLSSQYFKRATLTSDPHLLIEHESKFESSGIYKDKFPFVPGMIVCARNNDLEMMKLLHNKHGDDEYYPFQPKDPEDIEGSYVACFRHDGNHSKKTYLDVPQWLYFAIFNGNNDMIEWTTRNFGISLRDIEKKYGNGWMDFWSAHSRFYENFSDDVFVFSHAFGFGEEYHLFSSDMFRVVSLYIAEWITTHGRDRIQVIEKRYGCKIRVSIPKDKRLPCILWIICSHGFSFPVGYLDPIRKIFKNILFDPDKRYQSKILFDNKKDFMKFYSSRFHFSRVHRVVCTRIHDKKADVYGVILEGNVEDVVYIRNTLEEPDYRSFNHKIACKHMLKNGMASGYYGMSLFSESGQIETDRCAIRLFP